jgi:sugar phosphate isomerase/epimerase
MSASFKQSVNDSQYFKDKLQLVKKEGYYDYIEFYFEGDKNQCEKIKRLIGKNRFDSIFLAGFPMKKDKIDIADFDNEKRAEALEAVKRLIDKAYYFESKKLVIVSGKTYENEEDRKKAFGYLCESIKQLCRYAKTKAQNYTLDLTLEYFNDKGEPFYLIGPSESARQLAECVSSEYDNFEITFDLSHSLQLREEPVQALNETKRYVNHIHLANCVISDKKDAFYGDKHPPFNVSNGEVFNDDLIQFLKESCENDSLYDKGKDIIIGLEVITPEGCDDDDIYHKSTEIFKKAMVQAQIK